MKHHIRIITFIILSGARFSSDAQSYDFRNFNVDEGLAQSSVLCMCQDKYGNIWMGTNGGGVSRFDGIKFTNFTENDSLVNNVVYSITELKNGNMLFGTNGGLSIYTGKTFINLKEKKRIVA